MADEIKFSIITTSYNYSDYIKETIESVLNQTYKNWEMIVVDDGSSDNSIEIIESYCKKDERIKLFTHENHINKGLKETLKLAISKAQNDWLIILESDDKILPNYIEKKLEIIKQHPEVNFIFNDVNLFGCENRIREYDQYFKSTKQILLNNPYPNKLFPYFKKINLIPTFSSVAIKKDLFNNVDFDSPIKAILDYYLWIQIAKNANIYYLDEKLTDWRMHQSYITNSKVNNKDRAFFNYKKRVFYLSSYQKFLIPILYIIAMIDIVKKNIIKIRPKERKIFFLNKEYKF